MSRNSQQKHARSIEERAKLIASMEVFRNDTQFIIEQQQLADSEPCGSAASFSMQNIRNRFRIDAVSLQRFFDQSLILADERVSDHSLSDALAMAKASGYEPELKTICEYRKISPVLIRHLNAIDEPLLLNEQGCWWGRTSQGIPIARDPVILRIAKTREDIR